MSYAVQSRSGLRFVFFALVIILVVFLSLRLNKIDVYSPKFGFIQKIPAPRAQNFSRNSPLVRQIGIANITEKSTGTHNPPNAKTCESIASRKSHSPVVASQFIDSTNLFLNAKNVPNSLKIEEVQSKLDPEFLERMAQKLALPFESDILRRASCGRCVVVGSGGCLRDYKLGKLIDSYDIVVRVNSAPLKGYEELVGSRTDIRFLYPESSPSDVSFFKSKNSSGVLMDMLYKPSDLLWIANLMNIPHNYTAKFWKSAPKELPLPNEDLFVINPTVQEVLADDIKKLSGSGSRNRATGGTVALYSSLYMCAQVDVAGFCYLNKSNIKWAYYYGKNLMTKEMTMGPHNRNSENDLRKLIWNDGLISHDLTGGFAGS